MNEIMIFAIAGFLVFGAALYFISGKKSNVIKKISDPKKIFKMRWGDGQITTIIDIIPVKREGKINFIHRKDMFSSPRMITVPDSSVSGYNKMMFKAKKYTFCCHMYDSNGNKLDTYGDEIGELMKQLKERDDEVERLQDELNSTKSELDDVKKKSDERVDRLLDKVKELSGRQSYYKKPPSDEYFYDDQEKGGRQ